MIIFPIYISNWYCKIECYKNKYATLKTRDDVYICSHGAWISRVYSKEIERRRFQIQTKGEICTECKYTRVNNFFFTGSLYRITKQNIETWLSNIYIHHLDEYSLK